MPKLLDFLKDKEISHAEAMAFIEEHYSNPDVPSSEPKVPPVEGEEIDNSDDETDEETKALVKKLADEEEAKIKKLADEEEAKIKKLADDEEAKIIADKAKVAKLVQDELSRRGKIKRKTPSKGGITDTPKVNYELNTNGYEVKTTRRIKS